MSILLQNCYNLKLYVTFLLSKLYIFMVFYLAYDFLITDAIQVKMYRRNSKSYKNNILLYKRFPVKKETNFLVSFSTYSGYY